MDCWMMTIEDTYRSEELVDIAGGWAQQYWLATLWLSSSITPSIEQQYYQLHSCCNSWFLENYYYGFFLFEWNKIKVGNCEMMSSRVFRMNLKSEFLKLLPTSTFLYITFDRKTLFLFCKKHMIHNKMLFPTVYCLFMFNFAFVL